MKNTLYWWLLLLSMTFVAACSDGGEDVVEPDPKPTPSKPAITLDVSSADFTTDGGSNTISFTTAAPWTAEVLNSRADAWCSVSPTSGPAGDAEITVTTTANDTPDNRSASIVLKAGTTEKTITVSQKQKDALTVTSDKFEVSAEGGEVTIEVKANIDFEYTISEKAKVWIASADSRALKTTTLVFNVSANEDTEKREGSITITSGSFKETVTVYQEGTVPVITLTQNEFVVPSAGDVIAVEVKSNVDVEVELPAETDWLSEDKSRAMSTNTYYFIIAESQEYDQREAFIKFTNKKNELSETVKVVQVQKDAIVVAKNEYEMDVEGGALDFEILTNVDVTVTIPDSVADWITHVESRALESQTLHFDVAPNESENERMGVITLAGGDAVQIITIRQGFEDLWEEGMTPPDDEIWYTSSNNTIIEPKFPDSFGANIVSNIYKNGKGLIKFDGKVIRIDDSAFYECYSLSSVIFPTCIISIGDHAFYGCALSEVTIPESVTELHGYAFRNCPIKEFKGKYASDDGMFLYKDNYNGTGLKYMFSFARGSEVSEYTIPEGIQGIEAYTFENVPTLRKLSFPASLCDINSAEAFRGTYNIEVIDGSNVLEDKRSLVVDNTLLFVAGKGLSEYTTPKGVTNLSYGVLAQKQELETVVISDDVTTVDKNVVGCEMSLGYIMWSCPKLKTVTISARMEYLGWDPWGVGDEYSNCDNLETVYLRAPIPPVITHNFPEQIQFDKLTIYVPKESLTSYQASNNWAPYRKYFKGYDYGDLSEFYPDHYFSTDYSQDGKVTTLQASSVGNGIDVVLMGDGYSDRQIADGTYQTDMENLYNNLFTEEPYKSFKDYFNVYYVNVVSATEGYEHSGAALGGFFGDGTLVGGNDNAVFDYALKAISEEEMDEALLIVAMNSDNYAGTCYMYQPELGGDYGSGPSVSYFPKGGDATTFAQLLHHEACGHGFAKLADEYAYEEYGTISVDEINAIKEQQNYWGWWKNVDFTNDLSQIRWSKFINDSRYANEGLGAYEGGLTYWTGVWRPTENSIMRYNTGGFNAPSREAIYYRIHKLAYGADWQYDYEKFVEWDAINRNSTTARSLNHVEVPKKFKPLHAPVVKRQTWKDAK